VVAGVGPGGAEGQRHPVPTDQQRVFRALSAAIHGASSGRITAAEGPQDDGIDDDQLGGELVGLPQHPQQIDVQAVPDTHLLPAAEVAVGADAGAAQLRRDVLPAAAGREDEPQHVHHDPVADGGPAAGGTDLLLGREVMDGDLEECIRHAGLSHGRRLPSPKGCLSAVQLPCRRFC